MTTPNDNKPSIQAHQSGDWLVHDVPTLRDRPWGEISWAIFHGTWLSVIVTYLAVSNLTNIKATKPLAMILLGSAIAGSSVSLHMNRKKFTYLRRTEKFFPHK
jgi:uncharacterized integral membrane protein